MNIIKPILLATVSLFLVAGCTQKEEAFTYKKTTEKINHVHGAGFSDNHLYIATHTGIMKHDGKDWLSTTGNLHDYMGFSMTKDGFYSSGHPGEGSDLKNPLGLMKSVDDGETLEQLAFYGETDFHHLSAGFDSGAIYVLNPEPNSLIGSGLFYTLDEGKTWESGKIDSIKTEAIGSIAAHPNEAGSLAVSTMNGIYHSTNFGADFELVTEPLTIPAVSFQGDHLLYSVITEEQSLLYKQKLGDKEATKLSIPKLQADNPIIYIAGNHENPDQIAFITSNIDIFSSTDQGATWSKIASQGKTD